MSTFPTPGKLVSDSPWRTTRESCHRPPPSVEEELADLGQVRLDPWVVLAVLDDLLVRMQDSGVIPSPEGLTDGGEARGRLFADDVHGYLAGEDDVAVTPFAAHL